MSTLLQINASLFEHGQSSQLANRFVDRWRDIHPRGEVLVRDLAADPVPHLTADRFGAFLTDPAARNAGQADVVAYSDALISELRQADVIVFGLPMYNFGIPSTLKAYFDHVARAGITFRYTPEGAVGLLTGKRAYVFAARGGVYLGTPADTQTAYVRNFLRFLGIEDVEFIYAEGLALGDEPKARSLAAAHAVVGELAL